jgi:diguanylate cyclase (GGDEF)-like protein
MFSPSSATEAAFLIVALIQAVFAVLWAAGAWLVTARRPLIHWAAWSALSAITWLILSATLKSPPLMGVLIGVLGVIALERGVCLFIGRRTRDYLHLALLVVIVAGYWLTLGPEKRHLGAAVNYAVLAWLYFNVARDMYFHARNALPWRWTPLLAVPVSLGSLICALRVARALLDPESVVTVMTTDSALNLRTALATVALSLILHATLVGLVVARLVSELQRLSRHDALTGLLNRRAMEEALDGQLQRSRRTSQPFAVMMLDLDHFKRINDQHGHAVGDLALKHVAQLLQQAMRATDSLARFGGEEFIVLMPNAALSQAEPVAEELRRLLAGSPLMHDASDVTLSVSVGVAQWRDAEDDASRLLSRADAALFQAKVQGRNRVVAAVGSASVAGARA